MPKKLVTGLAALLAISAVPTVLPDHAAGASQRAQPRRAPAARPDPYRPRWSYSGPANGQPPAAAYGPPNAGAYAVLTCAGRGIEISLVDVDPDPARTRAILTSGNLRFETPTVFGGDAFATVSFVVPFGTPVLANLPANGFAVSFRNGERDPFPGGAALTRLINACRRGSVQMG